MNKILVTGGCGFIGSHLVDALLDGGREVVVLDDLSTGKKENIPMAHERLAFVHGCVTDYELVMRASEGADQVVHLAAISSVQFSVEKPQRAHAVNFDGTLNVLEAARQHHVKKVLFASSAAVYGDTAHIPVGEDACPNPLTPYAADKLACEHYLSFYQRHFGIDTLTFRFFNVYGPRQDASSPYSGVISLFVDKILKRNSVVVYGDGKQTRDFVFVGDVVETLLWGLGNEQVHGKVLNLGSGNQTSLLELIDVLGEATGDQVEVEYRDARPGDIRDSLADVTKLGALFEGRRVTPFSEGIMALLAR